MKFYKKQKNSGFTLIELMIATTLFTIIMMMGVGSLVVSSNSAKAAQKLRIAVDNVNFAMESMTRELRMGTHYYCNTIYEILDDNAVRDCSGETIIAFNPQIVSGSSPRVAYYRTERELLDEYGNKTYTLERCELDSSNIKECSDIVSKDVNIDTLKFYVRGSTPPASFDEIQPSVRILIKGSVKIKGEETHFSLQTMASQRSTEK